MTWLNVRDCFSMRDEVPASFRRAVISSRDHLESAREPCIEDETNGDVHILRSLRKGRCLVPLLALIMDRATSIQ